MNTDELYLLLLLRLANIQHFLAFRQALARFLFGCFLMYRYVWFLLSLVHIHFQCSASGDSFSCLQCFDAVGWAAGRASGL